MKVRKMCILKIGQKARSGTSHVAGQAWGRDMAPAECGKQPSHNSLSHCPRHGLGLGKVRPSAAHLGAGVGCGLSRDCLSTGSRGDSREGAGVATGTHLLFTE